MNRLAMPVLPCLLLLGACQGVRPVDSAEPLDVVSDAALRQVVDGWSLGSWEEIHSARKDERGDAWIDMSAESPWGRWDVVAIEPARIEIATSDGPRTRVGLFDGAYHDFGPVGEDGAVGDPFTVPIVEAVVLSATEWQLFLQWPPAPDAPEGVLDFSELRMTGDVLVWSNWQGPSFDEKERISLSVNRVGGR